MLRVNLMSGRHRRAAVIYGKFTVQANNPQKKNYLLDGKKKKLDSKNKNSHNATTNKEQSSCWYYKRMGPTGYLRPALCRGPPGREQLNVRVEGSAHVATATVRRKLSPADGVVQ